jgi:hypothetical protein
MPTVSKKQEKFMQAVAHNPAFAKKAGVPQSVGKEFTKSGGGMPLKLLTESEKRSKDSDEDKRKVVGGMKKGGKVKKMAMGGMGQRPPTMPGKPMPPNPVSRPPTMPGKPMPTMPGKPMPGPMPRPTSMPMTNVKPAMGMMKKGGKVKKMAMGGYADGGMPMVMKGGQKVPAFAADGKGKMAKGGLAAGHKSADGVARRGKTKAEQVKMAGGGKTKKYC